MSGIYAYILYDDTHFGVFSEEYLAMEIVKRLRCKVEFHTSPVIMLYRIQDLIENHPEWEKHKFKMNHLLVSVEKENRKIEEMIIKTNFKDGSETPYFVHDIRLGGLEHAIIRC